MNWPAVYPVKFELSSEQLFDLFQVQRVAGKKSVATSSPSVYVYATDEYIKATAYSSRLTAICTVRTTHVPPVEFSIAAKSLHKLLPALRKACDLPTQVMVTERYVQFTVMGKVYEYSTPSQRFWAARLPSEEIAPLPCSLNESGIILNPEHLKLIYDLFSTIYYSKVGKATFNSAYGIRLMFGSSTDTVRVRNANALGDVDLELFVHPIQQ